MAPTTDHLVIADTSLLRMIGNGKPAREIAFTRGETHVLRRTMHTFAVIGLLGMTMTLTTGVTLGANASNSTHLPQKSSAGSSDTKKSVDPIKPADIGALNTRKVGQ